MVLMGLVFLSVTVVNLIGLFVWILIVAWLEDYIEAFRRRWER